MRTVLIVHPDADTWLAGMPGLDVEATTAGTPQEARTYLAGTAFDAVMVGEGVDPGGRVEALRDALGLSTPVETVVGPDDVARVLAGARVVASPTGALRQVRGELARIAHALNNPLAVIAGNAQLAAELARAIPTDEAIVEAIESIGTAATELEGLFEEVAGLRSLIDRVAGPGSE